MDGVFGPVADGYAWNDFSKLSRGLRNARWAGFLRINLFTLSTYCLINSYFPATGLK
jgi:hypothetical protein